MSARQAIKAPRTAGVRLGIDGDALTLEADAAPSAVVIEMLSRHKEGVIALLRPARDGWSAENWLAFFDERACIAEFDGGLPRREAEARAFACCVAEWLNRNAASSPPGRCLGCGGAERAQDKLLPFGTDVAGHAWLHSRCWAAWREARQAEAVAALATLGIHHSGFARKPGGGDAHGGGG